MRIKVGEVRQCARCKLDVQYWGAGIWIDRGGNAICFASKRGSKHKPQKEA